MKNVFLVMVFVFAIGSNTNAKNEIKNDKPISVQYPDFWAGANAAEALHCGYVRCDFEYWDKVYSACMGYE